MKLKEDVFINFNIIQNSISEELELIKDITLTFLKEQYSTISLVPGKNYFFSGVLRSQVGEIFTTFQIIWIFCQLNKSGASCLLSSTDINSPFTHPSSPFPHPGHLQQFTSRKKKSLHELKPESNLTHVSWLNILGKVLFACNAGDPGSIPGSGTPAEGNGTHSSILAWKTPWAEEPVGTVHEVTTEWRTLFMYYLIVVLLKRGWFWKSLRCSVKWKECAASIYT